MKKITDTLLASILLSVMITGCAGTNNPSKGVGTTSSVNQILNEQVSKYDSQGQVEEDDQLSNDKNNISFAKQQVGEEIGAKVLVNGENDKIGIDLTQMSSDMVYATVYQLMVNPNTYIGQTIKMEGSYQTIFYEPTNLYYHYCVIQDTTACCAQGMEFVWEDGKHIYPDEYPDENANIVVTGTFETYKEEGDEKLYCRLRDAVMEIKK